MDLLVEKSPPDTFGCPRRLGAHPALWDRALFGLVAAWLARKFVRTSDFSRADPSSRRNLVRPLQAESPAGRKVA